jgi:hypothetical protein
MQLRLIEAVTVASLLVVFCACSIYLCHKERSAERDKSPGRKEAPTAKNRANGRTQNFNSNFKYSTLFEYVLFHCAYKLSDMSMTQKTTSCCGA